MSTKTVRVDSTSRGAWEIGLAGGHGLVTCRTLEEARLSEWRTVRSLPTCL